MIEPKPDSERMRVDLVTRFSPLTTGGIQKQVRDIAAAVATACDVRVLAARTGGGIEWPNRLDRVPPWPDAIETGTGAPIVYHGLSAGWRAALAPIVYSPNRYIGHPLWQRYTDLLDRAYGRFGGYALAPYHRNVDLVHRFGGSKIALATVRAAHHHGVPVVVSPYAHRGQWDDDILSAQAYREADLVGAESPDARQLYLDLGVRPERVVSSPHMAAPIPKGSGDSVRRGLPAGAEIVLFVGASFEYKGGPLVVDVARRFAQRRPNTFFVLIGGGHEDEGLPNVITPGHVPDDTKAAWLDAADLVVLPSTNESYGLVIDEAWAAGTPVVATDLPELAGRINVAGAGVVVERTVDAFGAAIAALLDDDEHRGELSRAARSYWAENLSPSAFAAWWLERYRELAARTTSRR